jgi:hypothetical protein
MEGSLATSRNQLLMLRRHLRRKNLVKKRKKHLLMKIVIVFIGDVRRYTEKWITLIRNLVCFTLGGGILDQLERQ